MSKRKASVETDQYLKGVKKSCKTRDNSFQKQSMTLRDIYIHRHTIRSALFQRVNLKWNQMKRLSLWGSIKEGLSMGVITMWNADMHLCSNHVVIDGQHRLTSIIHMFERPREYILSREETMEPFEHFGLRDVSLQWIQSLEGKNLIDLVEYLECQADAFNTFVQVYYPKINLPDSILNNLQIALKREIDILETKIHMDVYFGAATRDKMHKIFITQNEKGGDITKWELFGAISSIEEKPMLPDLTVIFQTFTGNRHFLKLDISNYETCTLHAFLQSVALYVMDKYAHICNTCFRQKPKNPEEGLTLDETIYKWKSGCIEYFSKLFLILFGVTKYNDLMGIVPWDTLQNQSNFLERLCDAFEECVSIYRRFEKPATAKTKRRHHFSKFIPPNTIYVHIAAFYGCNTDVEKVNLRKTILQHTIVEMCVGINAYPNSKSGIEGHIRRLKHGYYKTMPEILEDALNSVLYSETLYKNKWSKEAKMLIYLLSSDFTLDNIHARYDNEHCVAKELCEEWAKKGTPVDEYCIGNLNLLHYIPNRKKHSMDIITYMQQSLDGVALDERSFFKRWFCTPNEIRNGQVNPKAVERFFAKRTVTIKRELLKLIRRLTA